VCKDAQATEYGGGGAREKIKAELIFGVRIRSVAENPHQELSAKYPFRFAN
jgi:hypothetical protein